MKPTIPTIVMESRSILLQRVLDYVRSGYAEYTSGTIGVEKLPRFVKKMNLAYQVDCDKQQRCVRKRSGLANGVLLLYRAGKSDDVLWWLLVSAGDHPARGAEKLRPIENMSIFGFQITRETRKDKDKPVMTWKMTHDCYQGWRDDIISSVRSRSVYKMTATLSELFGLPGFSGIRKMVGALCVLYRAEVKRHGLAGIAPPTPKRLGYVRRLQTRGQTVRQVAAEKEERSFFSGCLLL